MTSYSLKAACSHCNRYGTVDDVTLICFNCGKTHEITEPQMHQREADRALLNVALTVRLDRTEAFAA